MPWSSALNGGKVRLCARKVQGKSKERRREVDRFSSPVQPFSAWRCLLSEPRRLILAFAMRTASALVDCFREAFFGFWLVSDVIGRDGINVIESCSTGCTLMGPVNGGFGRGMADNALRANWFNPGPTPRDPLASSIERQGGLIL